MSAVARLTLVSHGMTDAMAAGRFPADESLNVVGRAQVGALAGVVSADRALTAPEKRARETAELVGLSAGIERRLADLDYGNWCGGTLAGIPPEQLARWLAEPGSAPHGGESIVELITRVNDWMADIGRTPGRTVAVTHPGVIRAAILIAVDAPSDSFWRIDIAPAGRTSLHFRGSRWTLRSGFDQR